MEEDKVIKRKKRIKKIFKIFSYTIIVILMIITAFMLFYIINEKIANKKGTKEPYKLYTIVSTSMEPSIKKHDVILVKNINIKDINIGDVITFYSTNIYFGNIPITHRVIDKINIDNEIVFKTKGDANEITDGEDVKEDKIVGKVIFKIPSLGKLQFFITSKAGWFIVILIPIVTILGYDVYKLLRLRKLKKDLDEINQIK